MRASTHDIDCSTAYEDLFQMCTRRCEAGHNVLRRRRWNTMGADKYSRKTIKSKSKCAPLNSTTTEPPAEHLSLSFLTRHSTFNNYSPHPTTLHLKFQSQAKGQKHCIIHVPAEKQTSPSPSTRRSTAQLQYHLQNTYIPHVLAIQHSIITRHMQPLLILAVL